eukprot:gene13124-8970_t
MGCGYTDSIDSVGSSVRMLFQVGIIFKACAEPYLMGICLRCGCRFVGLIVWRATTIVVVMFAGGYYVKLMLASKCYVVQVRYFSFLSIGWYSFGCFLGARLMFTFDTLIADDRCFWFTCMVVLC